MDFEYTIQYQQFFSDTNKLILLNNHLDITDIYKEGYKYFISVNFGYLPTFYFQLECTKENMNQIIKNKLQKYFSQIGIIAKIVDIRKIDITVRAKIDYDYVETGENTYESSPFSYITIQGTDDFYLEGKLINLYIQKQE